METFKHQWPKTFLSALLACTYMLSQHFHGRGALMRALLPAARALLSAQPLTTAAQLYSLSSTAMTVATEVQAATPSKRQKQAHYEHTREVGRGGATAVPVKLNQTAQNPRHAAELYGCLRDPS